MRKAVLIVLILTISLLDFRVSALPTTTLTFKVLERDYNQYLILDFEGSDDIDYSYTITEDDPDGRLNYVEPYADTGISYTGSYSLNFTIYSDPSSSTTYKCTIIYEFSPMLHDLFYRYIFKIYSYQSVTIKIYVDGGLIEENSFSGGTGSEYSTYDSNWKEIDNKTDLMGFKELKVEFTFSESTTQGAELYLYFYIDTGKRFRDIVKEKSLTVEYWSERIDIDTYRVHYTLDSSQLTGTWWVAYIEGSYYIEREQ